VICCVCQKGEAETGMVCGPDRNRIQGVLDDIHEYHGQLPDALIREGSAGPKVTGSREAPLPLKVDVLDLTLPARQDAVTEQHLPRVVTAVVPVKVIRTVWHKGIPVHPDHMEHGVPQIVEEWITAGERRLVRDQQHRLITAPAGDQIGNVSVAAVLDSWVRDWIDVRAIGERRPIASVSSLYGWLSVRLDWACDEHPAIDEFATELRHLRGALRAALGLIEPKPQLMDQPCPECGYLSLIRRPGEEYIDCDRDECQRVYTMTEYAEWLRPIAELAKERLAA